MPETQKTSFLTWILAAVFGIPLFFCILVTCDNSAPRTGVTPDAPRADPAAMPGDQVFLMEPSSGYALLATTDAAYDRMLKIAIAKDAIGMQEQLDSGEVLLVPSGTRALLIETAVFSLKVRVLEGKHFGRAGWVARERVVRAPSATPK